MRNTFRILILTIFILINSMGNCVFAETDENDTHSIVEEKIYNTATINDEFSVGEVIVVIDPENSEINKEWTISNFPGINIRAIEDMFYLDDEEAIEWINEETFQQILMLHLVENTKEAVLEAIDVLEGLSFVYSASPNMIYTVEMPETDQAAETSTSVATYSAQTSTVVNMPVDYYTDNNEILYKMSLPNAWNIHTEGWGALIGIVDSGVDRTHPDLEGLFPVSKGINFTDDGLTAFDDEVGHGTRVAGLIGAIGNNGKGIAGVCWGGLPMASLKALKAVTNSWGVTIGSGKTEWLINAINYATSEKIKLLNVSMGGAGINPALTVAVNNYPGLMVCAAGNLIANETTADLDNDIRPIYPASYPNNNIISVTSIMSDDTLDADAHYGALSVDLAAYGSYIMSTLAGGIYGISNGTSMATPFVTGVAALIMSFTDWELTPVQVKQCILNGTDYLPSLEGKCVTEGKLNAFRAIKNAMELGAGTTAAGDFDGDGTDEIAGFYGRGPNMALIYWQNNNSTFDLESGTVGCFSNAFNVSNIVGSVAALDYDADGADEIGALFDYGNYVGFWIFDLMGTSTFHPRLVGTTGTFSESVQFRVTSGDVDGNGREELFALYNYGNGSYYGWWIFHQGADGTFHHSRLGNTGAMAADAINGRIAGGDFDGDGRSELGILYDNNTSGNNVIQMLMMDYTGGACTLTTIGTTGVTTYGAMKGLISAGDYDGDGIDEMMGLYGHDQNTANPFLRIWLYDRNPNGSFSHSCSDPYYQINQSVFAYTMVTGDFNLASNRDTMAGIFDYTTYSSIWGFGRPTNSTWYCHKMM